MDADESQLFEPGPRKLAAIESIHVDRLHGKFTYDIEMAGGGLRPAGEDSSSLFSVNEDRLTLLYGNNGSGKTSLLRLLFHALSPAEERGHREALEGTRFASLLIRMTSGAEVRYLRSGEALSGGFRAEIDLPGGETRSEGERTVTWDYFPEDEFRRRSVYGAESVEATYVTAKLFIDTLDAGRGRFLECLRALELNPVFLSDSRAITADVLDGGERVTPAGRHASARRVAQRGRLHPDDPLFDTRVHDVEDALTRVRAYLSQLAFAGTQAGTQRVDTVYLNVANAIIQHTSKVGRPNKQLLPRLRKDVESLGKRARPFHAYGLLPEFPSSALIDLLADAPDRNGPVLEQVLTPYLAGLAQRMDALEPGLRAIASFIDALNSFLEGKRANFRPGTGAQGVWITDEETDERIAASELSSGEKQIVLLFSDIVALQDQTRLFVIDEPELSLNPQWQRQLMPALLAVTERSNMQVIAATHSIEIMAKYRRRIRRLGGE